MRNSKSKSYIFFIPILLCLSLVIVFPQKVLSWGGPHTSTAYEAYHIALSKFIESKYPEHDYIFIRVIKEAVIRPDQNKVINHINVSECAWKTNQLANKSEKMLLANDNWVDTLVTMGEAAHYVQDMNCPHHGIGRYIEGNHEKFELHAGKGFWTPEKFDGFQYIVNYKNLIYNAARFSKRYIKFDNPRFYSDDEEYYRKVMEPLWDHTVNDVIDLWLTILYNGLGEEQYRIYGFPEKTGTRAEKKIKYPRIKDF